MKARLTGLYLDWCNNFCTLDCFASWYGLERHQASRVIRLGRILHERGVAVYRAQTALINARLAWLDKQIQANRHTP